MKWGGPGHIPVSKHLLSSRSGYTSRNLWLLNNLISGRAFRVSVEIIYHFSGCCVKLKLNLSASEVSLVPLNPPNLPLPSFPSESEPKHFLRQQLWDSDGSRLWPSDSAGDSPPLPDTFTQVRCPSRIFFPCWNNNYDSALNAAGFMQGFSTKRCRDAPGLRVHAQTNSCQH